MDTHDRPDLTPPDGTYFEGHETPPWIRRFVLVGGACTFLSAAVTLRGLSLLTGEMVMPVALTILSAIISFLLFAFLCRTVPRASAQQRGPLLLGVGLPALVLVGATSTLMGTQGIAGPEAQLLDRQLIADKAEDRVQALRKERLSQVEVVEMLKAQKSQFIQLAEDEERGRLTGREKEGKISYDLRAIADAFGTSATLLTANLGRRTQAEAKAIQAAAIMQQIAQFTDASAEELPKANAEYLQQLRIFTEALAQLEETMDDRDVLAPIHSALAQQAVTPPTAKTSDGRDRQTAAMSTVTQLGNQALSQTQEALERRQVALPSERDDFRIPRPMESVTRHFWAVVHLVAYPIALDFLFPIVALVSLTLMHAQARRGVRQRRSGPDISSPNLHKEQHGHPTSFAHDPLLQRIEAELNRQHRSPPGRQPTVP